MKRFKKIFSLILAALMFLSIIPAETILANTSNTNKSYVSAIRIKEVIDGLAPFDNDNNPGNDENPSNGIVRSFDNINYTLEYVTALKETETTINDGYMMAEFILPYTKEIATFDMDTMSWMIDPKLTVNNGKQILTGKRYLKNTENNNAIPGAGTLSVGIKVQAAPNETVICPEFKLWMEGNSQNEIKSIISEKITVSAAPKYNIEVVKSSTLNYLGYFNEKTGQEGSKNDGVSKYGRMQGYSFNISIWNDSIEKGFKGIELINGPLEFDIKLKSSTQAYGDLTLKEGYTPLIWDFIENQYGIKNGKAGRKMIFRNNSYTTFGLGSGFQNKNASDTWPPLHDSCYDGGNYTMTKTDENTYHFVLKDYVIKMDKKYLPSVRFGESLVPINGYGTSIGVFSSMYSQILLQFPEDAAGNNMFRDIYLEVNAQNLKGKSVSDQNIINNHPQDDRVVSSITLKPDGTFDKDHRFYSGTNGPVIWSDGDGAISRGKSFQAQMVISRESDYSTTKTRVMLKFDDKAFEPTGNNKAYSLIPNLKMGNTKFKYGAKKDKTGWIDHDEQIGLHEKDLIFFDSIEQLYSQGYTCVSILFEQDNCELWGGQWANMLSVLFGLKAKDSAQINQTYEFIGDAQIWEATNPNQYPIFKNTVSYKKTEYDSNGVMITGTHSGGPYEGQSLLIKGHDAGISSTISDLTDDGKVKTSYDMDINERTVNYELSPTITKSGAQNEKTNTYITTTIPKDLKYNINSAYLNNLKLDPLIQNNPDGSQILKWTLKNIVVNSNIGKLKFSCTIGKAGTNQDVVNNQQISVKSRIMSDEDKRAEKPEYGNVSTTTFSIIKLNAISIAKTTDTPQVAIGQKFNYHFKFANNSQNKIENAKLYDVLPFNGDDRGSKFSGSYKIDSITLDFKNAPKTFVEYKAKNPAVQYTTDKGIQSSDFKIISSFNKWSSLPLRTINEADKIVSFTNIPNDIKGLLINTSLEGFEYIDIKLSITPINVGNSSQKEGDVYINDIYENSPGQVEQVHSNIAVVQVNGRLKITKIWKDDSNIYNTRPSQIDITVYQNENVYKNITLTGQGDTWEQTLTNVPLYDENGNKYTYTIKENENDTNLKFFYEKPVYDQSKLTVMNEAIFIPDVMDEFVDYKIIIKKDILNSSNQIATKEDFDKVSLDFDDTYNFPITLKQLNRTVTNTGTELIESYSGYSGKEFKGILTNKGDLIFNLGSTGYGKYEISESINQYFDFIDIEKVNDKLNSNGATFTKENGKYYITLSGLTGQFEQITVKVKNQLKPDRPYNAREDKINLFR